MCDDNLIDQQICSCGIIVEQRQTGSHNWVENEQLCSAMIRLA